MKKKLVGMLATATLLTMALAGNVQGQKSVRWGRHVEPQLEPARLQVHEIRTHT